MTDNTQDFKPALDTDQTLTLSEEYKTVLKDLKNTIRSARLKAALAVNHEVIRLYWHIGKQINDQKDWGSQLIHSLSHDLGNTFPKTSGFSQRSLQRMRQFSAYYPDFEMMPQAVAQLPWSHVSVLIHKVKNDLMRNWYAEQAQEQGWPRPELERNIKENLYGQQALISTESSGHSVRLPSPQSQLAQELLEQPYNFDFLGLHNETHEREI